MNQSDQLLLLTSDIQTLVHVPLVAYKEANREEQVSCANFFLLLFCSILFCFLLNWKSSSLKCLDGS